MLDATTNHIALGNGNNMGDSIPRVNNSAGERTVLNLINWNVEIKASHQSGVRHFITADDDQDAARANTAWTAIYRPGTLKVSNMISAVNSRFSGGFKGGSVNNT
jgi:hypothetical protein